MRSRSTWAINEQSMAGVASNLAPLKNPSYAKSCNMCSDITVLQPPLNPFRGFCRVGGRDTFGGHDMFLGHDHCHW